MWQAQGEDKAQSGWCGQVPGAPLTPTAAAYLVHHLELIPEALHLLFQVLEFILLDSQQHLGTHVLRALGQGDQIHTALQPGSSVTQGSLCSLHPTESPCILQPTAPGGPMPLLSFSSPLPTLCML